MNMSKSRDIQAKMPSPKVIFYAFWLVTVKVLNSYDILNKDIRPKPPAGYRSVKEVYRKIIFRHAQGEHGKK